MAIKKDWEIIPKEVRQVLWLGKETVLLTPHKQTYPSPNDGYCNVYIEDRGFFTADRITRRNVPIGKIRKRISWLKNKPTAIILVGFHEGDNASFLDDLVREKDNKIEETELQLKNSREVNLLYDNLLSEMREKNLTVNDVLDKIEIVRQAMLKISPPAPTTPVELKVGKE